MLHKNDSITLKVIIIVLLLTTSAHANSYFDKYLYPEEPKTISMDFKNAMLMDVLKIFSQQSGLNFIASDQVSNLVVNLYLDKVPVEEALERILTANNLTYEIKPGSNIFIVKALRRQTNSDLITRTYKLKHASVPSSKLLSSLSDTSGKAKKKDEGTSGLIAAIEAVVSDTGKIVEDARTNSLIITDVPSQFPLIEQTIAKLDVRIPLILIDVEMLDVSKAIADQLGVKWGSTPISFVAGAKQIGFPFNEDNITDDNVKTHTEGARDGLYEDARYTPGSISFGGLKFDLEFIRTHTDTKNLANPKILTLNNETAEISVKTNEVIGITRTVSRNDDLLEDTREAERYETGVFLSVTPQANIATGEIVLAVEPKVIITRRSAFAGDEFRDPEERSTKSILRVRDGDTVILGGLLRDDKSETETKIPVLGDIPIIGVPFRHKDVSGFERELIVFITPHILTDDTALGMANKISSNTIMREQANSIVREQSVPAKKLNEIDKQLKLAEQKYSQNSYTRTNRNTFPFER